MARETINSVEDRRPRWPGPWLSNPASCAILPPEWWWLFVGFVLPHAALVCGVLPGGGADLLQLQP